METVATAAGQEQDLVDWCASHGVRLVVGEHTLQLQDRTLSRAGWLKLLQRCQQTAGSPEPVLRLVHKLGENAGKARVADECFHIRGNAVLGVMLGLVRAVNLPADALVGDLVDVSSSGPESYLVSFTNFWVADDGAVVVRKGHVLGKPGSDAEFQDVLAQPFVLGFNRTYQCEEDTSSGWLEDLASDSLSVAKLSAEEIQRYGSKARIVNRITGEAVAWH